MWLFHLKTGFRKSDKYSHKGFTETALCTVFCFFKGVTEQEVQKKAQPSWLSRPVEVQKTGLESLLKALLDLVVKTVWILLREISDFFYAHRLVRGYVKIIQNV